MIVEYKAAYEFVSRRRFKFAQSREIAASQRGRSLDFDPDDTAFLVFKYEIDFISVFGAEMRKRDPAVAPANQLAKLGKNEALEEWAKAIRNSLRKHWTELAKRRKQPARPIVNIVTSNR